MRARPILMTQRHQTAQKTSATKNCPDVSKMTKTPKKSIPEPLYLKYESTVMHHKKGAARHNNAQSIGRFNRDANSKPKASKMLCESTKRTAL